MLLEVIVLPEVFLSEAVARPFVLLEEAFTAVCFSTFSAGEQIILLFQQPPTLNGRAVS